MTDKHARFVEEFLVDSNATQAAIRAGYSAATAKQQGSRLLTYADVAEAIAERRARHADNSGITAERVLAELALLAFSDVRHYEINDTGHVSLAPGVPEAAGRAISSIKRKVRTFRNGDEPVTEYETELKLWDKPGPLKLAGKHVGLFNEKPDFDLSALPDEVFELLKRQLAVH